MTQHKFYHYSATGNTFIIFDNRSGWFPTQNTELIKDLAHNLSTERTDGFILIEDSEKFDVKMNYYNCDGSQGEMCGNGARATAYCAVADLELNSNIHLETMNSNYPCLVDSAKGTVEIQMSDILDYDTHNISDLYEAKSSLFVDTGVPHCVFEVEDALALDLDSVCPSIRSQKRFSKGSNVGFFNRTNDSKIFYRSFERGVEAETKSCGTGVFAASLLFEKEYGLSKLEVETKGGSVIVNKSEKYHFTGKVELLNSGFYTP